MSETTITITGPAKSGKSAIAQAIVFHLASHGMADVHYLVGKGEAVRPMSVVDSILATHPICSQRIIVETALSLRSEIAA